MSKILKMSLGILLFSTMLVLYGCGGGGSSSASDASNPQTVKSFVLNLQGNPTYINTESAQISGNKITLMTPVGTKAINTLTANITTIDGVVHNNVPLTTSSQITSEPKATISYIVTAESGLTNGYTVAITIPETLFSCKADTSTSSPSECGCLIQNDGSGLVWYISGVSINYPIFSNTPESQWVPQATDYLTTQFNPESHCGYSDWMVPTSESYGSYPNSAASIYSGYYLWDAESSDPTNIGHLGYFAANNSESSFNASESVAGFTGWLNQGPPVTPPSYAEIASFLGMQPDRAFLIQSPDFSIDSTVYHSQFFLGTYDIYDGASVYSGLVGFYYVDYYLANALGLLPVRGGQ